MKIVSDSLKTLLLVCGVVGMMRVAFYYDFLALFTMLLMASEYKGDIKSYEK